MDNPRDKILSSVHQASFSAEDVSLWERVLAKTPDELLLDLAHFIEMSPNSINYLNENLKKKAEALEKGDEKLLDEVLTDQKKFLRSLAPSLNLNI
jgi:hypothetical protein